MNEKKKKKEKRKKESNGVRYRAIDDFFLSIGGQPRLVLHAFSCTPLQAQCREEGEKKESNHDYETARRDKLPEQLPWALRGKYFSVATPKVHSSPGMDLHFHW